MQLPHVVKRITRPIIGRVPVTISGGPNQGLRWSLASSGNGFRRGTREPERMVHLDSLVHPGDTVWDVGAHYGYVTLLLARRVAPTSRSRTSTSAGTLHAFEPASQSRWYLSRHVRWNGLDNVTVHPYALSDFDGESVFGGGDSSQLNALGGGDESVQVRRASTLVRARSCPPPTFMKIDVEGAEAEVLRGALEILPPDARLFVATHSKEKYDACRALMASAGFEGVPATAIERARSEDWPGDPDVFFFGPGYERAADDLRRLRESGF